MSAEQFLAGMRRLAAEDRFSVGSWEAGLTGAPVVGGALATFECKLERFIEHTTHAIVRTTLSDGHSLIYLDGNFSSISRPLTKSQPQTRLGITSAIRQA
jgi:flavin reductase (DIM6/NTAB) family NADH-FMN oxidoreductase RutF